LPLSSEFGEFVDVLFEQIGQTPDQPSALAGGHFPPRAVAVFESTTGRLNRAVYVSSGCFRNLSQNFACRRVGGVEVL